DPAARAGRGHHRLQRDRAGHRVLDRGPARLPVRDRAKEAGRLDHLEVVVTHGQARAGLEGLVVALPGRGELGRRVLGLVALTHADPELAHPAEVPQQQALGAVDLEAVRALLADGDPAGLQRHPGTTVHPQQAADIVLVLDRARLATLDDGEVGAHA